DPYLDLFDPHGDSPGDRSRGAPPAALPALENWMRRHFKPLVITLVIAAASILTVTRHGRPGFGQSAATPGGDHRYDLSSLRVFDSALKHVVDSYVDPGRVDPKAMLLAALDNVQKQVAEVLVEPRPI